MNKEELRNRTRTFAISVVRTVASLPKDKVAEVLGYQLLKSGASIGANYREACRARSRTDFLSKMGIVKQEVDETLYWLELLEELKLVEPQVLAPLQKECGELLAQFVATCKSNRSPKPPA